MTDPMTPVEHDTPPPHPLRLWEQFAQTDPRYTDEFVRPGGFKGTSINAMYSVHRMTAQFGPCGLGWGIEPPQFTYQPGPDGQLLVFCTVQVWYVEDSQKGIVRGVGGDTVIGKTDRGLRMDDESLKKAYTDAVGNALKYLGMSADVYLGLYDDSKYVNTLRTKFKADDQGHHERVDRPTPDMTQPRTGQNRQRPNLRKMWAVLRHQGIPETDFRDWIAAQGWEIEHTKDMTDAQIDKVLRLAAQGKAAFTTPADPILADIAKGAQMPDHGWRQRLSADLKQLYSARGDTALVRECLTALLDPQTPPGHAEHLLHKLADALLAEAQVEAD